MAEILVVAEHRSHSLADISLQMLTKGRQLADHAGAELVGVVIGRDVRGYAEEISRWVDRVLAVTNAKMDELLAEPCQRILASIMKERKPRLVLIGHSAFGMELAPSLAVELGFPIVTDCTNICLNNDSIVVTRAIYNGKVNAVYSIAACETAIATGRVGEFAIEESGKRGSIEEINFPLEEEFGHKRFEGLIEQEAVGADITQSDILVSIGRGIKDKENVKIAEELANALGGLVACSRPVVDYGWLPSEHQVGLSGKTVKPKLYIALGISGAFQHMIGLRGSKMIVAINKDPRAPIFSVADYGIVDDLFKVVPALTQKITEIKG